MSEPVLAFEGVGRVLTTEIVPVTLVQDVTCAIMPGEFVAVTGASGSGKSSMLYLMGLLDRPTSGRIFIEGADMTGADEDVLQRTRLEKIGFVFQFHFLLQEFSARDNVMLPMRKLGKMKDRDMKARADNLIDMLGLKKGTADKMPNQLSGGERQRIAIARALANNPRLILADEPTGNLDSKNTAGVIDIFRRLAREEHVAVAAVTHDPEFAAVCDRRIVMKDGKINEEGHVT